MKALRYNSIRLTKTYQTIAAVWVVLLLLASTAQAQDCSPYSTLACADVTQAPPVSLTFDGTEGGLTDGSAGTGFTMAAPQSATDPATSGYDASKLSVDGSGTGTLTISTTAGIFYQNAGATSGSPNEQLNALGTGFDASGSGLITVETEMVNLPSLSSGTSYEQAGLYFGLGDQNYVKLIVIANAGGGSEYNVQLGYEEGDAYFGGNHDPDLEQETGSAAFSPSDDAVLKLEVDPSTNEATGYYSTDGGSTFTQVGSTISIDASLFAGIDYDSDAGTDPASFAGVMTTHRNGSTLDFAFDSFDLSQAAGTNQAPQIDTISDQNIEEGQTLDVSVSATDADGAPITLTAATTGGSALPPFASFTDNGSGSGTLSLAPQSGDAGTYDLTVTADDGNGGTASEDVAITVTAPSSGDGGLLVHWPFDEGSGSTATDASGNGRDGTISGASYTASGKVGSALSFAGGTDLVEDTDAENYLNNLSEVTVSVWVKSDQTDVDQGILGTLDSPNGHDYYLTLRYDQEGFTGNQPQVIKAGMRGGPVAPDGSDPPTNAQQYESAGNQQTTDWQHLALVWEAGQDPQLYIDGQLDTPSDRDGQSPVTGALEAIETLKIGQSTYGGSNWSGLIDEMRIYGSALSASEVSDLANPGSGNTAPSITSISDQNVEEGQTLDVGISASDGDASDTPALSIGIIEEETSTSVDASSYTFTDNGDGTADLSWTPQSGTAGDYIATVTADDGNGGTATEDFGITVEAPATAGDPIKINFQPDGSNVPSGYTADTGAPYGAQSNGETYGWLKTADDQPIDASSATRDRDYFSDQRIDTFNHLEHADCCDSGFLDEIYWQYDLPNGFYEVTLAFGDQPNNDNEYDSQHQVDIEGTLMPSTPFQPTSSQEFLQETVTVEVTDGTLTIKPTSAGANTKINYADIVPVSGSGNSAPVLASIGDQTVEEGQTLDVSVSASDGNSDPITLSAATTGGSALPFFASFTDDGSGSGTLSLAPQSGDAGTYDLTVTADDGNGGSDSETFTLSVVEPGAGPFSANVNFQAQSNTPPNGYLADWGQPYGSRTGANQGGGSYSYGWIDPQTGDPADLTALARDRTGTSQSDLLKATLVHMDHPNETKYSQPNGYWEIAVPENGRYQVVVTVGEADPGNDPETHRINAEGTTLIPGFVPQGNAGDDTRHAVGSGAVEVTDGKLTLGYAGGGENTKIDAVRVKRVDDERHYVTSPDPAPGATDVYLDKFISTGVGVPVSGGGTESSTVNSQNVLLYPTGSPGQTVSTNVNDTGGNDGIILTPSANLQANTQYTFEVTDGVKDIKNGKSFVPFEMTFITGNQTSDADDPPPLTEVEFDQVSSGATEDIQYTTLTFGPDGKLYGLTIDGDVVRWDVVRTDDPNTPGDERGTLKNETTITTVTGDNGGQRLAIGLHFDPDATASNLVAWVSHTSYGFGGEPNWQGRISKLSGPDLGTHQVYVKRLPRSAKDHVTNGIEFGPDGALYVNQGSLSAMGAPDNAWSNRDEALLSAAVLRVDVDAITNPPLDVKTTDDGTYDPYATNAPVKLFATGLRNAYDLVWHSNGNFYAAANGSASGGNTPASVQGTTRPDGTPYNGPDVDGLSNVSTRHDYLFRVPEPQNNTSGDIVSTDGWSWNYHYYGHPNPTRGEYVLNGGDPTDGDGNDPGDVAEYPGGTQPDAAYFGFAYDFGTSKSPNGIIEYQSDIFGSALEGKIMVCRFSGGDDLIVLLDPDDTNGDIEEANTSITGLSGFDDPLDLTEDPVTGSIYVAEHDRGSGDNAKVTLLRPVGISGDVPALAASKDELIWSGYVASGKPDYSVDVELSNTGGVALDISSITTSGADGGAFSVGSSSLSIPAGGSATVTVTFDPSSTGPKSAALDIASNDTDNSSFSIPLYALASQDFEGSDEPPLAQVVQTLGYDIDVGFTSLASDGNSFPIGDEQLVDLFEKAGSGNVEITPVARYSPDFEVPFGWYTPDGTDSPTVNAVGTLSGDGSDSNPHHQMLFPPLKGSGTTFDPAELSFDPGSGSFGFFAQSPQETGYTEDVLNEPTNDDSKHRVRVYPLKDRGGNTIADTYLIGFEEAHNHDHNDYVFVISNVQPATADDGILAAAPSPVDFGAVVTSETGTQTVTLSNAGDVNIGLTNISVTGDAAYSIATDPLPSTVAANGGSADLELQLAPSTTGSKTATLTIEHDGNNSPLTVSLSGSGTEVSDVIARFSAGATESYTDGNNNTWSADNTSYLTDNAGDMDSKTASQGQIAVDGTQDDELYYTRRWGTDFSYDIPVPASGDYVVNLHFAEPYWGGDGDCSGSDGCAGDRIFDVSVEGTTVLNDYDLFADAGYGMAVVKTYEVTVDDGTMNLHFQVVDNKDNAIISAIEVLSTGDGGTETFAASFDPDWNLFGLPLDASDKSASAIFSDATPTAGPFAYNGSYQQVTSFSKSEAYWLKFDQAASQTIEGAPISNVTVQLEEGWNLITGPSCSAPLSGATGDTGILIGGTLYSYGNSGYSNTTALVPGEGYWIKASSAGQVTLDCQPPPAAKTQSAPAVAASKQGQSSLSQLIVQDQAGHRQTLYMGQSSSQTSYALPPVPPAGAFDARFEGDSRLLSKEAGVVTLQGARFPLELRLRPSAKSPGDAKTRYTVEEMAGGQVLRTHQLQAGQAVELADASVEQLRVARVEVPEAFALEGNYPNPFNPSTTVEVALPERAEVSVEVYNVLGQQVMTLPARELSAGKQGVRVDASRLGSGMYLYRVIARMDDGATQTATGRMTLVK